MKSSERKFKQLYHLVLKEKPQKAGAIVWLQGNRYARAAKALKLYKQGWSKKIILSGNNVLVGSAKPGENNISLEQMKKFLLKKGVPQKAIIIDDGAMNTKDQAVHVFKITKKKRWSSLILIGTSYYQPRALLTFLKQAKKIKWGGRIINQPVVIAWDKKPSGRNKNARYCFDEEFIKIKKYKKDLVSISQGIKYLNKSK